MSSKSFCVRWCLPFFSSAVLFGFVIYISPVGPSGPGAVVDELFKGFVSPDELSVRVLTHLGKSWAATPTQESASLSYSR